MSRRAHTGRSSEWSRSVARRRRPCCPARTIRANDMMNQEPFERSVPPRRVTPLAVTPVQTPDELLFPLARPLVEKMVHRALVEDGAYNDITTIATVLSNRRARGTLVARQQGVVAGAPPALEAFRLVDPKVSIRIDVEDGVRVATSHPILFVTGHARAVLS